MGKWELLKQPHPLPRRAGAARESFRLTRGDSRYTKSLLSPLTNGEERFFSVNHELKVAAWNSLPLRGLTTWSGPWNTVGYSWPMGRMPWKSSGETRFQQRIPNGSK
ncbi:hypothetical protein EVAR_835_1 [Eumeta japonica]|uniref:Uncharacterized protein n=1 Tax=Eumeta variegata TaxID=151549 RepID=A0A4C1SGB0_EUMVA|nr:hypothetical protein EVAR_835_1 [Eumeta japonica]